MVPKLRERRSEQVFKFGVTGYRCGFPAFAEASAGEENLYGSNTQTLAVIKKYNSIMRILKKILVIIITINIFGLIGLLVTFFIKFNGGFSLNPEHWYASGSFLVGFLSMLITIMIAIYVSEITKQSTRFPEQRKIYNELMITTDYVFELFHSNLYYMDFQIKMDTLIRSLNIL